ncbi:MjaI family restriction endonuclease [Sphingobacterium sp. SGG-5]|uniref:MjaI family restriction endonuclease n=1 Tax=Sphingobacterium sp. SGG-5 TaxID=2710881 RepID=UPI0013EBE8DE|nr:MjaI family restriction endonuclease [Sphingobacterium sp. SGG-5]NGM62685.1 MjaI family restriction endonuclease [Sphingobacterium sp. SGG-5]
MPADYISGHEGVNLKFKRETLLNYANGRWALTKAHSVGPTSELIRACAPEVFENWEAFYFQHATQKKKNGERITREYIISLGQRLYVKLTEIVQQELSAITEEECIEYVYNLVINRTYEGYVGEIQTIYGQLQVLIGHDIIAAPDNWDRNYGVDFYIEINGRYIGLQIKPISSGMALNDYQWIEMHRINHERFEQAFGGKVFFVYSIKIGDKKNIHNIDVVEQIKTEIFRLQAM